MIKNRLSILHNSFLILCVFIVISCVSFWPVFTDKFIYGTWDSAFPLTVPQVISQIQKSLSIINDHYSMGFADNQSPMSFYYYLLILPFVWLFSIHALKVIMISVVCMSGFFMWKLLHNIKVSDTNSLLFAILYMFNPFTYTRLVAGHINLSMCMVFLPILINLCLDIFVYRKKLSISIFIQMLVLSVGLAISPVAIGITCVIIIICFIFTAFSSKFSISIILYPMLFGFIMILSNIHWITPMVANLMENKPFFRNDLSVSEEKVVRIKKAKGSATPLSYPIMFYNKEGLDTEYAFPVINLRYWLIAQCILLLIGIYYLIRKRDSRVYNLFLFLFLFGSCLASGMGNGLGVLIYERILFYTGPFFFEFANSNRFLPIPIIAGIIVFALGADMVSRNLKRRNIYFVTLLLLVIIGIRVQPYFTGELFRKHNSSSIPYSYMFSQFDSRTQYMLDIMNLQYDTRSMILPSFQVSPIDVSEMNFGTQTGVSNVEDFFNGVAIYHPYQLYVLSLFGQENANTEYIGKLLGLANVSMLIDPKYATYRSYISYGHLKSIGVTETLYDATNIISNIINSQKDIQLSNNEYLNELKMYINKSNLQRIYGFDNLYLSTEGFETLLYLADSPYFDFKTSNVAFVKSIKTNDLSLFTNIIKHDDSYGNLYERFIDSKYRIKFNAGIVTNVMDVFQGELEYAQIPTKQKGFVLQSGKYPFSIGNTSDQNTIVIKIIKSSAKEVRVEDQQICQLGEKCEGIKIITINSRDTTNLTVMDGVFAYEFAYLMPSNEFNSTEDKMKQYLSSKNIINLTTSETNIDNGFGKSDNGTILTTNQSNNITFKKIDSTHYKVHMNVVPKYLYFSFAYNPDWNIRGFENIKKIPGGAEGIIFVLDKNMPNDITIEFSGQKYISFGYCILGGIWIVFILVVIGLIAQKKMYGKK